MSRQALEKKDFTFVGGLNTEAGYLTFPNNAWLDGDNLEPSIDGSINRRSKMDFEANSQLISSFTTSSKETMAYGSHLWQNVGGHGDITFTVVQQAATIRFFTTSAASLTPNAKSFTLDLTPYKVATSPNVFGTSPIDVSVGNGKLVIVSEDTDPILVEYDLATDTITTTKLVLKIRDFAGVNDEYAVDERRSSAGFDATVVKHQYNLQNQGWNSAPPGSYQDYQASTGLWPSNAQIWTAGKDASDVFSPTQLDKQFFGTAHAPRGRYILDVFHRDRATVYGNTAWDQAGYLPTEVENYRPTATAFFAGRVWYSGIKSSSIGSWVLFSQITENNKNYQQCYQEGDPTSEFNSDLLATDGGYIPIPEAGGIKKLIPVQQSLIVFADNGIWQISGGLSGFSGTGYQVLKVSAFGCISQSSVCVVEETAMYWSPAGIFALKYEPVSTSFSTSSVSLGKIQSLYSDISAFGKKYSSGFYNDETKKVYWLYQETENDTLIDRFKKTRMLVFDSRLGAFYTYTIATGVLYPIVIDGILITSQGNQTLAFDVLSGTDSVLSSTDTVDVSLTLSASTARQNKFLTLSPNAGNWSITFSDMNATQDAPHKFKDWYSFDSVGIETTVLPYLLTGFQDLEDGAKEFQAPYIQTYMKRTETGFSSSSGQLSAVNESSCLLQGHWDWTDSTAAGRWTPATEVYRHRRLFTPTDASTPYDDGYPLVVAKTKLRGKGRALSLLYSCTTGKDMQLAGWAILYAKNTNV